MRNTTLTFLVREEQVCLPMKKRGFGANRHNGYGGKQESDESIPSAAVRELYEESTVHVQERDLQKRAEIEFTFPEKPEWDQRVHVYIVQQWIGQPQETEEMFPKWFHKLSIPYQNMWPDDPYWLSHILEGKYIKAKFSLGVDQSTIFSKDIQVYTRNLFAQVF